MITKVVEKGARVRGLVEYLWGPGRHNEHVNPRIVAAWDETFVPAPGAPVLDSFERGLLAREMEAPLRWHDVVPGGHVYHVPVAIHAEDGELSDEQWGEVAQRAAERLGFTEGPDRSAVPWMAMRHGPGDGGQDHIHFVAVLRRESGHVPNTRGDFKVWGRVRSEFDAKWNLRSGREDGAGMPGLTQAELKKAERGGEPESPRTRLARGVRAAAVAARDEAEFLQRVREDGVLIRPRWATGGQRDVVGYSVALRPEQRGYKPVWFGGGTLAGDLKLSRLREMWEAPDADRAADIRRGWRPRGWRQMPTGTQLQRRRLRAQAWEEAGRVTTQVRSQLASLEPHDVLGWADVARHNAGAVAALAGRLEDRYRGPLSRAADSLARVAQTDRSEIVGSRRSATRPLAGVARAAVDAALVSRGGTVAVATLVAQLGRLTRDVERAHRASGRAVQARHAAAAARDMLTYVHRAPTTVAERAPDMARGARPNTVSAQRREQDDRGR